MAGTVPGNVSLTLCLIILIMILCGNAITSVSQVRKQKMK